MSSIQNRRNYLGPLASLLTAAAVLFLISFSCARALTADELAAHLGVKNWETTVNYPAGTFSVSVLKIVKGKVEPSDSPGYVGDKNDPAGDRLALMISRVHGTLQATLVLGDLTANFAIDDRYDFSLGPNLCIALPREIQAGDYILGGNFGGKKVDTRLQMKGLSPRAVKRNISEVKQGLLLRIERN